MNINNDIMEDSVKERLKMFLRELNIKAIEFCDSIQVSVGYISSMRESIQPDKLKSIAINYPELNIGWLMTGEGNMLNSPSVNKKAQLSEVIATLGITKTEFANKIGVKEYNIDKILSGELPIGPNTLRKLESVFNINSEWITRGVGSMFTDKEVENKPQRTNSTSVMLHAIKYYPSVNGSMGGVQFLDNPDEMSVEIVIPGFSDCQFAVNAYGDSMHPVIKSGQIVVMMEWTESFIDWGKIYFVVTKNGYRAIKYLRPSETEGCIKCVSENALENPSFDVEINDIHKLFLVKGWICREAI